MHFKAYEYVIVLAEEQNFSKAAKRLFISQPSLSQYISRIENELNVTLFERGSVPLVLTYEGELYVETAKKIMDMNRQLLATYEDSKKTKRGRLHVGITLSKTNYLLPLILPIFKEEYPDIEITITESSAAELEELLEKSLIDMGILNIPVSSGHIVCEPVFTEKILLAAPKSSGYAGKAVLTFPGGLKRLENEQFILMQPDSRIGQVVNELFAKADIKPKIIMQTRNIETAARLTAAGMGLTFVPETLLLYSPFDGLLEYMEIGEPTLTVTLGIAYKKDRYISQAAAAFADITKRVINNMKL